MDAQEKWLCRKEVGSRLGVSPDTVSRWIKGKKLRALKLPGESSRLNRVYDSYRIAESEMLRFERTRMTF